MATNNNSNNTLVPNAKDALNQMKYEIAGQLGVNLKQGYNGDLTSAQAGSIGGEMTKRMVGYAQQNMANAQNANAVNNSSNNMG